MKRIYAGAGLLFLSAAIAYSEPLTCERALCTYEVQVASVAADKFYGLLFGAPHGECRQLRYRVETEAGVLLGKSQPLAAGEVAVVRIGTGFSRGVHTLLVTAEGCCEAPILARRVTLRKPSPDHGWRATLIVASMPKAC